MSFNSVLSPTTSKFIDFDSSQQQKLQNQTKPIQIIYIESPIILRSANAHPTSS